MKASDRDSRFELLRIIAMFIIVLHHLIIHSAIDFQLSASVNRIVSQLYIVGGKVGVNIFLLISGYFGINSRFKISKALKIEGQVLMITILSLILMLIFCPGRVESNGILMSVFPVTYKAYWYITAYMLLFLISPLINAAAKQVTKNQYRYILFILLFTQAITTTFLRMWNWTNDVTWFVFVYLIGGYVKRTENEERRMKKGWLILSVLSVLLVWGISIYRLKVAEAGTIKFSDINMYILSNSSFFALMIAYFLFMFFATMNPFSCGIINIISKQTLGIYLLQSNIYISTILWEKISGLKLYEKRLWPLWAIFVTFAVFVICCVLEGLRAYIASKVKIITRILRKTDDYFDKLMIR